MKNNKAQIPVKIKDNPRMSQASKFPAYHLKVSFVDNPYKVPHKHSFFSAKYEDQRDINH